MIEYKTAKGESVFQASPSELARALPQIPDTAHKGVRGRVVVVGGSKDYVGAPFLAALGAAAMQSGAGLSTVAVPSSLAASLRDRVIYSSVFELPEKDGYVVYNRDTADRLFSRADAVVLGCGAARGDTNAYCDYVLDRTNAVLVLDADGLNNLSEITGCNPQDFDGLGRTVLTPHMAEFARLTDTSVLDISENAVELVREFASATSSVVLFKGVSSLCGEPENGGLIWDVPDCAPSLVSDGKTVFVNTTGNAKLAKGGSGDVLGGVIGALAAAGTPPLESALLASWLCGKAAELSAVNPFSYLPTDTVDGLPEAFDLLLSVK